MVDDSAAKEDEDTTRPKVFLRFRPTNKLEASKRSKDCIELHDDATKVTVDAPLQGLFDFAFDSVFDEYITQQEVYQESGLDKIPKKLIKDGIDCTVIGYGQTSSGKTHLILGPSAMTDLVQLQRPDTEEKESETTATGLDPSQGMMARLVFDLFHFIQTEVRPSTECIIKFSMAELYLERWIDLLGQQGGHETSTSTIWIDPQSRMHGASELCCIHPHDVIRAMIRGTLRRMKSATDQNQDATRSHVLLQLRVEQIDREANTAGATTLRVVDLAGSEQGKTRSSRQVNSPLALEGRMVSASIQSLFNYVRAKIASQSPSTSQGRTGRMHPSQAYANVSKLTKMLQSSLDGPCCTTIFLTASPSSYNIGETLNTLKFGTKIRQLCLSPPSVSLKNVWTDLSFRDYPSKLQQAERRVENLTKFVQLLAVECRIVRKTGKIKQPHAVWDVISRIAKSSSDSEADASDLIISVTRKENEIQKNEVDEPSVLQKLEDAQTARDIAESKMRDSQSEVSALKAETEFLKKEKSRLERDLQESRDEAENTNKAKNELERRLRTSRFRENEAVVFLRQFRSFYLRLLKSKASHGNGDVGLTVNDIIHQVAGTSDLKDLLDVDRLMIQSGMIEPHESAEDTNDPNYSPTEDAIEKSEKEAEFAEDREIRAMENVRGGRLEPGEETVYRQKLVESPSGRLALKKEKEIEDSVVELSSKCIGLQNSLNAEKAMVEALSARQGALGKMKAAQEMNAIKSELERRSNDLQAIVWKMNELHLVNKTVNEKVENRESHVAYLEENNANLQQQTCQLLAEKQGSEKKLRDEIQGLKDHLDGASVKLWQLGEESSEFGKCLKLIVPACGVPLDLKCNSTDRRISVGDIAEEGIELLEPPAERKSEVSVTTQTDPEPENDPVETLDANMQTDGIILDIDDAAVQTDPVQVSETSERDPSETSNGDAEATIAPGQTEAFASQRVENSVQTEGTVKLVVECEDMGAQTISELQYDIGVQTEDSDAVQTIAIRETTEAAIQTNDATNRDSKSRTETTETAVQTERERTTICFEAGTQTDELPEEIALHMSKSNDSSSSLVQEVDDDFMSSLAARAKRPPKLRPPAGEQSSSKHDLGDGVNAHSSFASLGSFTSLNKTVQPSPTPTNKLRVGMKKSGSIATVTMNDRLGASMSALQGPAQKTTDWRAKLRQKGEDIPVTPTPPSKGNAGKQTWAASDAKIGSISSRQATSKILAPAGISKPTKKSSNATPAGDATIPEWMTKFKEMGIKADGDEEEDEVPAEDTSQAKSTANVLPTFGGVPSIPSYLPTEKPDWMQKLKSSKSPKPTSGESNSTNSISTSNHSPKGEKGTLPVAPWAKHMRRSSIGGPIASREPSMVTLSSQEPEWVQARRASTAVKEGPPAAELPSFLEAPSQMVVDQGPEWIQRFKEIGMKGEEQVIESSRTEEVVEDEKVSEETASEKVPEWMLKFQQITGSCDAPDAI